MNLVDPPGLPPGWRGPLTELKRWEWRFGDGGDPAAQLSEMLSEHGAERLGRRDDTTAVVLLAGADACAALGGTAGGAASPVPAVPDLVAIAVRDRGRQRPPPGSVAAPEPAWSTTWRDDEHAQAVERVRDEIARGGVYQANVVGHRQARHYARPVDIAAVVASLPGAAYAGVLTGDGWAVGCASPEQLVRVDGDHVTTVPVKGTRPVAPGARDELVTSAKDRAEHIMIVDLERNDLARVAATGSVAVDDLFAVSEWAGLWHAASTVGATLRRDVGTVQVLRALLPGGSVTGAPKLAACSLLAAVEPVGRGPQWALSASCTQAGSTSRSRSARSPSTPTRCICGPAAGSRGGATLRTRSRRRTRKLRRECAVSRGRRARRAGDLDRCACPVYSALVQAFVLDAIPVRDFVSVDPTTGGLLETFDSHPPQRVRGDLELTHRAQRDWAEVPVHERAAVLVKVADQFLQDRDALARLAVREMGKTLAEALAEIDKCAWTLRHFAHHGPDALAEELVASDATDSYIGFRPLGVVLAVMPWNFPYWQVVRFAAGALLAGNAVLLKHAENVTRCALALEATLRKAGAPDHLLKVSLMSVPAVHECIADPLVSAVTLTGSTRAGRAVAASAGRALKKSVLELGGSDAFIVLADADLQRAAEAAALSRFQNAGQTCIAAKRVIVESSVLAEFTSLLVAQAQAVNVGDPLAADTNMGPLARRDLRDAVHQQVQASVAQGARPAVGGRIPTDPGWFYPPTVLTAVRIDMTVAQEEVFGPVACVMEASDAEDALRLANSSDFGLGGNIWTADVDRGKALGRRMESGSVFVNGITGSDARLPFGGVKQSGYGRELSSFGLREFTNVQTTWVGPRIGTATTVPSE